MCSNLRTSFVPSTTYLRNNESRLVLRWDGDYKWTYRVCVPQIGWRPETQGGAQLVAGPPPSAFSISGHASWCKDLWKKEKKNPELVRV